MNRTFLSWRAHYGEHEKIDPLIEWLLLARDKIATDEDFEIVILSDLENNQIRFHIGKLIETEVLDPDAPYEIESISTVVLDCVRYVYDDDGNLVYHGWEK